MCIGMFLILLVALFMFYRGIKQSIRQVEEDIDSRISMMENKIDEIYTLVYKLGDVLNSIKTKTCGSDVEAAKRSEKAKYAREYRKRKNGISPSRSAKMKAYWEKRRANAALEPHRTEDTPSQ